MTAELTRRYLTNELLYGIIMDGWHFSFTKLYLNKSNYKVERLAVPT